MASINIHQAGEHQIVLGDSLKDSADADSALLDIKYNWLPKAGFENKKGTISDSHGQVNLKLGSKDDEYLYTGWQTDAPSEQLQLVLVYDSERSVYVLEKLTASLSMNIKSASKVPDDQIKRYVPLKRTNSVGNEAGDASDGNDLFDDGSDESPDPTNPFDYRNFISEAKQQTERQAQRGGISTPMAGSRTPMSGLSSPMPRQSQFDTPALASIEIVATSGKKLEDFPRKRQIHAEQKAKTQKRSQPAKTNTARPKALSEAVIVDSDSDSDAPPPPKPSKGHTRNVSNISQSRSPQIYVNDAEIDSDSSSSARELSHIESTRPNLAEASQMLDADMDADIAQFLEDDDEDDSGGKNADVADLDLEFDEAPSPPAIIAPQPKRRSSMRKRKPRSPSPPNESHSSTADDYDGGLAAELEAALEKEAQSDDNHAGVGLGIAVTAGQDDESDISEEE